MPIIDNLLQIINQSYLIIEKLNEDSPFYESMLEIEKRKYTDTLKKNLDNLKNQLREIDINQPTGKELTLLGYLARSNWLEAAKYLVEEKGANVNQVETNGKTPLHAAAFGQLEVVKYLIEKGADVNQVDAEGNTALHYTAVGLMYKKNIDILKLLIKSGATVKENINGSTPLALAQENAPIEAMHLLITLTLLNDLTHSQPGNIQKNQDLSAYWDEQVLKFQYLLENPMMGCQKQTKKILDKALLCKDEKKPLFHFMVNNLFFKLINSNKIKSYNYNKSSQCEFKMN